MKDIKYFILPILIAVILAASCEEDDDNGRSLAIDQPFVAFFLQLDNNGDPIDFPEVDLGASAVSEYDKNRYQTLKIPVALTSKPLSQTVTVDYEIESSNIDDLEITPDQLNFEGSQLVDTLYVKTNSDWNEDDDPQIKIQLTNVSDPDILIGVPNEDFPMDELTINFREVDLIYGVLGSSLRQISGNDDEEIIIDLNFPNGFLEEDLEGFEPFTATESNFDFELERQPNPDESTVRYSVNIEDDFDIDAQTYRTLLQLNELENSSFIGSTTVELVRNAITPRNLALNTASNFYNTSDQFYRLYGEHWFDSNANGECDWSSFNTFALPVIVDDDDPNAILGDDNGTATTDDDVYYHAFRIGFKPPLDDRTTNPFNLRRWFTNEGSNESTSPGLNIVPALEFFPDDDGESATSGTVIVVEQTITIGTTASNGSISEDFRISGSGTYQEVSDGIFRIDLEFSATNERLFGGTRTDTYVIYNTSNFEEPAPLNIECKQPIAL